MVELLDRAGVDRKAGFRLRYLQKAQLVIVDETVYTPIARAQTSRFFSFVSDVYELVLPDVHNEQGDHPVR